MNQSPARYREVLVAFMSYHHNRPYTADKKFSLKEMLELTPINIADYFCIRSFGHLNPTEYDEACLCRASTLEVDKKSLSFFMPNKIMPWNAATLSPLLPSAKG